MQTINVSTRRTRTECPLHHQHFLLLPNSERIYKEKPVSLLGGFTQTLQKMMLVVRPKINTQAKVFVHFIFCFLEISFFYFALFASELLTILMCLAHFGFWQTIILNDFWVFLKLFFLIFNLHVFEGICWHRVMFMI